MKSLITGKLPPLNFGELKSESKICVVVVVKIDCTRKEKISANKKPFDCQREEF